MFKMHISSLRASVCDVFTAFQLLVLLLLSHLLYSGKFQVKTSVLKCYAPFWTTAIFFLIPKFAYFFFIIPRCFVLPAPTPTIFFPLLLTIVQALEELLEDFFPFVSPCTDVTKNSTFTFCPFFDGLRPKSVKDWRD